MNHHPLESDSPTDWALLLHSQARAHGAPLITGQQKSVPEHFQVHEIMPVEPDGSGEHCWLWLRKTRQNTDQVARQLARFANVAHRDIGYSGLKDFQAVTEQWFSVWLPGQTTPDWSRFAMPGVEILRVERHSRKIKRGTHAGNKFRILLDKLSYLPNADANALTERLQTIKQSGVPNYFGPQRFGRQAGNLSQVSELFDGSRKVKNRALRGLLISAARAFLFNQIVSERIQTGSWSTLFTGEPANLDGTSSTFTASGERIENARLVAMDIHPTAPLWGAVNDEVVGAYLQLHKLESQTIAAYSRLSRGLENLGAKYQRRAVRMPVSDFEWQLQPSSLQLKFSLRKGQFATSVVRELMDSSAELA